MTTNRQNTKRNNFSFGFRDRKKPISKVIKGLPVDYKDVDVLISYISDRAKISSAYRVGNDANNYEYNGNSVGYDPLGKCLAKNDKGMETCLIIELNKEVQNKIRDKFKFLDDKDIFNIQ